ncbi:hypothetical protein BN938_1168 [Mucinivorans hirudinis]|uniref:Uncharacterized protein n=1 Tax=Mucinivorans hirudinis TaxID=1433126 RepID=A0A060RBV1_9BACT|nr:hypothetical protein BN938_1168 [Mucinivorans hirudinis]
MAQFTIREELASDFDEVYSLIQKTFLPAKVADGCEQDFTKTYQNYCCTIKNSNQRIRAIVGVFFYWTTTGGNVTLA